MKIVIGLALCVVTGLVAAQTINPQLKVAPQVLHMRPYDPGKDITQLRKDLAALQAQMGQLGTENSELEAQLKKQDASIGQLTVQLVAHQQALNSLDDGVDGVAADMTTVSANVSALSTNLSTLSTSFAGHQHTYQHANLTSTKVQVVKDTGGLTSPVVNGWASYINDFWNFDDKTSTPL